MSIDLHTYTTASDGSYTPSELVRYARKKGLTAIAVTDHDTTDGNAEAVAEGRRQDIQVIPGVEISVDHTPACTNWGVQYVLLGDDVATVPCRHAYVRANENQAESYLPTDLYFACLDGSWNRDGDKRWGEPTDGEGGNDVDLLAEVWVGRAPVDTPEEAASFVAKTLRYEREGNRHSRSVLFAGEYLGRFSPDIAAQGGAMFDPLLPRLRNWTVRWLDDRPHITPQWDSRQAIRALNESPHWVCSSGHGERDAMMRLKPGDLGARSCRPFGWKQSLAAQMSSGGWLPRSNRNSHRASTKRFKS